MAEVWVVGGTANREAVDALRQVTGWGVADAARALRGAPTAVVVGVDDAVAGRHVGELRTAGVAAEVRPDAGSAVLDPGGDLAEVAAADPELAPLLDRLGAVERRLRAAFTVSDDEATEVAVAVVRAYRAGTAARRARLHDALRVCPKVRWYVDGQVGRAAQAFRAGGEPSWVASALWAAAAADGGLDWRDTILTVEDLLVAAADRGVDTAPTLAEAVRWGSTVLAELITGRWLPPAGTGGPPPPR